MNKSLEVLDNNFKGITSTNFEFQDYECLESKTEERFIPNEIKN